MVEQRASEGSTSFRKRERRGPCSETKSAATLTRTSTRRLVARVFIRDLDARKERA